jgi:hypothetical protein
MGDDEFEYRTRDRALGGKREFGEYALTGLEIAERKFKLLSKSHASIPADGRGDMTKQKLTIYERELGRHADDHDLLAEVRNLRRIVYDE